MKRWVIACIAFGILGAAAFYSPYNGLRLRVPLLCPLCPTITAVGRAWLSFARLTLLFGILNAAVAFLVTVIVRAVFADLKRILKKGDHE